MRFSKDNLTAYALTDRQWLGNKTLAQAVEECLQGGATCIQLREKQMGREELVAEAREIKAVCAKYGVPFLLDDEVEVARQVGADGVHVGQHDMELKEARRILGPDAIIGVSAHTVAEALEAERNGASYLGVGAVFPTSSKADAKPINHKEVRAICAAVSIPIVAIGGITLENIHELAGTGVSGIAGISMYFAAPDIKGATQALATEVRKMRETPSLAVPAALVDMDGTMLDTMPAWNRIGPDYVRSKGKTPRADLNERLMGMEMKEGAAFIKEEYGLPDDPALIVQDFLREMKAIYFEKAPLMPGARALLVRLKQEGKTIALLTSSDRECAEAALRRTGIYEFFDEIFTTTELKMEKRNPQIYYKVLGLLGADRNQTVLYDDADFALKAAEEAGLKAVKA